MSKWIKAAWMLVLLMPAFTAAQVRIQGGQALDANPQIGSGGFNTVAGGQGGVNSQLIINNQVSGLAGFRGSVGYFPANQLNLNLPSAGLNTFRQQSIGVGDVMSGNAYNIVPYYDRSNTALGLRGIVSGETAPGSDVPRYPTLIAPPQPFSSYLSYQPLAPPLPSGMPSLPPANQKPGYFLLFTGNEGQLGAPGGTTKAEKSFFGATDTAEAQRLAKELKELSGKSPEADLQVKTSVDLSVDTAVPTLPKRPKTRSEQLGEPNAPGSTEGQPSAVSPNALRPLKPTAAGQDAFTDLRSNIQRRRMREAGEVDLSGKPLPESLTLEQAKREVRAGRQIAGEQQPAVREDVPAEGKASVNLVDITAKDGLLLHSLSGTLQDQFNHRMGSGQAKLKEGMFRKAVQDFQSAAIIDPNNPLTYIGLSLALFGAGEPLGAATQLKRAMSIYPPVMQTRLDIPAMMDVKIVRQRLDFLSLRINNPKAGPEPALYFISAYMYHNLGDAVQAREFARELGATAGTDRIFLDTAAAILAGNTETPQPVDTPTSAPTGK